MKLKLLIVITVLTAINGYSQDNKTWSIENNYSIVPADGIGGGDIVINLGLKYRLVETGFLHLGLGIDAGYFTEPPFFARFNTNENLFLLQPKLVSEFDLPFSKNLKPTLGLGYSFFAGSSLGSSSFGGFNLNLGLTYNISDKWYIQFQYDYVSLKEIDSVEGFNNFRLGVGFRF